MDYSLINIETERLRFRKVDISDSKEWIKLFNSPKVAEHLGLDTSLPAETLNKMWFDKVFYRYDYNLGFMNAVILKESDQLIGQSGLLIQDIEGVEELEISYSVLPEFAGNGYALEAAQACKSYAKENNLADELISVINTDNYASEKVAKKNGMTLYRTIQRYKGGSDVNIYRVRL